MIDVVDKVGFEYQSSSRWHPYTDLLQEAFRRGTPVYFVDMVETPPGVSKEVDEKEQRAALLKKVETAVGGAAIGASILLSGPEVLESSAGTEHPKRSRRTFMRMAGKSGLAGFAAWALSRIPQEIAGDAARPPGSVPNEHSTTRHIEEDLGNLNYEIHPETRSMIIDMRNALIAQKSETVARLLEEKLGRKPCLALEIGADHFGIERELLKGAPDRVNELKRYLGKNLSSQNLIVRIQTVTGVDGGQKLDTAFLHDPAIEHADS